MPVLLPISFSLLLLLSTFSLFSPILVVGMHKPWPRLASVQYFIPSQTSLSDRSAANTHLLMLTTHSQYPSIIDYLQSIPIYSCWLPTANHVDCLQSILIYSCWLPSANTHLFMLTTYCQCPSIDVDYLQSLHIYYVDYLQSIPIYIMSITYSQYPSIMSTTYSQYQYILRRLPTVNYHFRWLVPI